jgi:hypothetical protein
MINPAIQVTISVPLSIGILGIWKFGMHPFGPNIPLFQDSIIPK